jgi:hypothetical protein
MHYFYGCMVRLSFPQPQIPTVNGGNKKGSTAGLPPLLVACQAVNIIVYRLGERFLCLSIAMKAILAPEKGLVKKHLLPIQSRIPPSPEQLSVQIPQSVQLLSTFIRNMVPFLSSDFRSLDSPILRLYDLLLPFREHYMSSRSLNLFMREKVFTLAIFRGILFGLTYLHEGLRTGSGLVQFQEPHKFLNMKVALRIAKNLDKDGIEAHLCSSNIYGACIGQMKTENVYHFWNATSGAETWFSRYSPSLRPFADTVQWIGNQTFHGMGPLLQLLLAGDLAYEGLVAHPTLKEMAELV